MMERVGDDVVAVVIRGVLEHNAAASHPIRSLTKTSPAPLELLV